MKRTIKTLVLIFIFFQMIGCASIPKEGSELSSELGNRISAMEQAHLALVHRYMDLKRKRIEEFITNEWIPIFAESYLSKPDIKKMWDKVNRDGKAEDKLKFFTIVATEAQEEISKKRLELITPFDEAERLIERKLKDEYAQIRAMNAALTGLLASASEVADAQGTMLRSFGVKDERLARLMSGIDEAVASLDKVESITQRYENIKSEIKKAIDELKRIE